MRFIFGLFMSVIVLFTTSAYSQADPFRAAADYSAARRGDALLVYIDGQKVFEEYQNGYDPSQPHLLASGTKSFSCALAVAAAQDGLLTFDEPVAQTLTEWQGLPGYEEITIRQLLSLTSGLPGSQELLQGRSPANKASAALQIPLAYLPGERFQYGPSHYYVFGELLRRKLGGEDVIDYLTRRVLAPIGLEGFTIRRDATGNPNLASGASLTASEWADYGLLILGDGRWQGLPVLDPLWLRECFSGTYANPYYGLTWWLEYDLASPNDLDHIARNGIEPGQIPEEVVLGQTAPQVIIAAGAGKQRLYIIPAYKMVVVRFGQEDRLFSDAELLPLLLGD